MVRKAEATNQLCASCHLNVWAQFQRPFHHKLPESDMSCVDCHNPHGSIRPAMLKSFASNEPGCFGCHGDKRGPFTFEHAPVRFEGCQACHEPHGSAFNPRMLIRANVRFVCLECHANLPSAPVKITGVVPPAFHDLRSPVFQNCTVCHQKDSRQPYRSEPAQMKALLDLSAEPAGSPRATDGGYTGNRTSDHDG